MGCVFCATGQMGFRRHLSSGEIVAQVLYYARVLKDENQAVTNVVLMGMGEPFHNYDNSMAAIDRLNEPEGYNFGARRFTVSTVGLVPQIRRFADEKRQVNLAISRSPYVTRTSLMKYAGIGWPSAFRKKPVSIGCDMIAFTTITSPWATRSGTRMRASPIDGLISRTR